MKIFEYTGFRLLVILFAIIPFRVLYWISDFVYILLYKVIKYRRTIVLDNLKECFPEKNSEEIEKLSKTFFHHLADITLESIKSMTISRKSLEKRYKIINPEVADKYFYDNKNILCFTSHYGNWEYGILTIGNILKHKSIAFYLPLSNKYSEKYGVKRRSRFGTFLIPVQETKKTLSAEHNRAIAVVFAADQSPSNTEKAIWVNFLNRNTACIHGPEGYAKKTNYPVLYMKISKPKRGYYSLEFLEIIGEPSEFAASEITKVYMNCLEKDILEQPEYWLWSHRRWKHRL